MAYNLQRTEKEISQAIGQVLDYAQVLGEIKYHDRLNSGAMIIAARGPNKRRAIRLCKPGTPDRYVILRNGKMVWIEVKTQKGRQTPDQQQFQEMIESLTGHYYILARSATEALEGIKAINRNA